MEDTDSERVGGIALEFPENNNDTLSSPKVPERLRQRLQESKSPITAEEIESKLAQAQLRRQVRLFPFVVLIPFFFFPFSFVSFGV